MRFEEQTPLPLYPIGRVRSPFLEKMAAPRQGPLATGVLSQIELFEDPRLLHALQGLSAWSHVWVLFWFDRDPHFCPKVQPPRSAQRRGVFGTRSPHRPNPIGMTVARLVEQRGLVLVFDGLDLLDQTPVLDLKPYVPYADCFTAASGGWLDDEVKSGAWHLQWAELTLHQVAFLDAQNLRLRDELARILEAGPNSNSARRIRRKGNRGLLAFKGFRLSFRVEGDTLELVRLDSGYRQRDLDSDPREELTVHRQFVAAFGRSELETWLEGGYFPR